jgi:peptidoglycan/LPS O-acetylase OafA/YrhL
MFILARANRIIPPLLVLYAFLMLFGWFALFSADYYKLGKHPFSSLGFVSNIIYWIESGYFDVVSQSK